MSLKALFCVELLPSAMDSNLNEFWILFAHSSWTSLFILLFISPQYCTFYSLFLPIFIYILLCFFALSIEQTCPDLHFTTDYILYN